MNIPPIGLPQFGPQPKIALEMPPWISKREFFAAMAMQAYLRDDMLWDAPQLMRMGECCVEAADKLIEALASENHKREQ